MRERWGSFSVIDHTDPAAFVPEVLLYDRLVIPVPYSNDDRQRWTKNGWEPDVLDKRLETMGDLAVKSVWDEVQQEAFHQRMEQIRFEAKTMAQEVREALPYQLTRMILAGQKPSDLLEGASDVAVVAAYQSEKDFEAAFILQEESDDKALLGLLLGQKIAVPSADDSPDEALEGAVSLARDAEFKKKRRSLYKWQERVLKDEIDPRNAIKEMDELTDDYNKCVKKAVKKVYYTYAFTVAGIALAGLAGTLATPLGSAAAFLAVMKFATLDRKPVINAGESEPAAVFHSASRIGKWKLY
jgi:hypothetical protein